MDIYLHQANYQGHSDSVYKSTQFYKIWIKQEGEKVIVRKQGDLTKESKREYENFNKFMDNWGMIQKDCHLIKFK